jgi:hypothetical protein
LLSRGAEFVPDTDVDVQKYASAGVPALYFYVEIYAPRIAGEPARTSLEVNVRVVDVRTGAVKADLGAVDALAYDTAGNPFISIGRGFSLSALGEGSYDLEMQAKDSNGHTTPWKKAKFTIEGARLSNPNKLRIQPLQ